MQLLSSEAVTHHETACVKQVFETFLFQEKKVTGNETVNKRFLILMVCVMPLILILNHSINTKHLQTRHSSLLLTPMRKLLQKWFRPLIIRLANKYSSRPDKQRVFAALTQLHGDITEGKEKKGLIIPFNATTDKIYCPVRPA